MLTDERPQGAQAQDGASAIVGKLCTMWLPRGPGNCPRAYDSGWLVR
jgi:hypothetical protein